MDTQDTQAQSHIGRASSAARLIPLGLAAAAVFAAILLFSGNEHFAIAITAAAAAALLFCLPPAAAMLLFITATFFQLIRFEVGFTLKPDYPFIFLVGLIVALRMKRNERISVPSAHAAVMAYILVNLISTSLGRIEPVYGFLQFGLVAIVACAYFAASEFFMRRPGAFARCFRFYLILGAIESLYGTLSYLLLKAGIATGGAYLAKTGSYYARGTMHEGNILGGFAAMHALILLNLAQSARPGAARRMLWAGTAIHFAALLLSNTRTAWFGFAVGVAVSMIAARRERLAERVNRYWRIIAILSAAAAVFCVITFATGAADPSAFTSRMSAFVNPAGEKSMKSRMTFYSNSLQYWKQHPFIGNGTGSFQYQYMKSTGGRGGGWVANQFLLSLQDTGIIGLAVTLWLVWATFAPFVDTLRRARPGSDHPLTIGFLSALVAAWVCFQSTTGTWLSYYWLFFGFAIAFIQAGRAGLLERFDARLVPAEDYLKKTDDEVPGEK